MTKHLTDEIFQRYHLPSEEANKLTENNVTILDGSSLRLCGAHSHAKAIRKVKIGPSLIEGKTARTKMNAFKGRLGKAMHRLYDLEIGNAADKPLNVDLDCDLYQMEKY